MENSPVWSRITSVFWMTGFLLVLLLCLLGPPAVVASWVAGYLAWHFWPTYLGTLGVTYFVIPHLWNGWIGGAENRLRKTPCRMCRTVPGDRAITKRSGRSLLVICPKCSEVGSLVAG